MYLIQDDIKIFMKEYEGITRRLEEKILALESQVLQLQTRMRDKGMRMARFTQRVSK